MILEIQHLSGGVGARCILVDAYSTTPFAGWDDASEVKDNLERLALELGLGRCEWDKNVSYAQYVERLTPFLSEVCNAFMIASWRDMKVEDVKRFCAAMPRLVALSLSMAQQSSLAALIVSSESKLQAGSVSIPLPKLEHLLINEFILHQQHPSKNTAMVPPKEWTATKKDMLDVVASRARVDIPLQSLTIKNAIGFDRS
ncbi:hypothetical protein PENSPDRAFT_699120 [Peniophora sp. CONT]|nr:hypothetical protein PENSPDRAFT_699120 [Peniophora sp. CONT]